MISDHISKRRGVCETIHVEMKSGVDDFVVRQRVGFQKCVLDSNSVSESEVSELDFRSE